MKIPRTTHSDQPWRIHEFTGDFRTEDVWSFRTPGAGPDDFPVILAAMQAAGGFAKPPRAVRFLFVARETRCPPRLGQAQDELREAGSTTV